MLLVKLYYAGTGPNPQNLLNTHNSNATNMTTCLHSCLHSYIVCVHIYYLICVCVCVSLSLSLSFVQHNMYILYIAIMYEIWL